MSLTRETERLKVFSPDGSGADLSALKIKYAFYPSPLGRCLLAEAQGRICYLGLGASLADPNLLEDLRASWPGAELLHGSNLEGFRVENFFSKEGPAGSGVNLLVRGTPFQVNVWRELLNIPAGQTRSYAGLAQSIGRAGAARAVANAVASNHIAWLIPCHRVIRSDGSIGGYRWGLASKKGCLDFENAF